jgi:hypothetical protein
LPKLWVAFEQDLEQYRRELRVLHRMFGSFDEARTS